MQPKDLRQLSRAVRAQNAQESVRLATAPTTEIDPTLDDLIKESNSAQRKQAQQQSTKKEVLTGMGKRGQWHKSEIFQQKSLYPKKGWEIKPTFVAKPLLIKTEPEIGSKKRLNLVTQLVKGMTISKALDQLAVCKKKGARQLERLIKGSKKEMDDYKLKLQAQGKAPPVSQQALTIGCGWTDKLWATPSVDIKGRAHHGIKHARGVRATLAIISHEKSDFTPQAIKERQKTPTKQMLRMLNLDKPLWNMRMPN